MPIMKAYKTVDEYLQNFSGETREILIKIRNIIHSAIPNAEQTISYGIPTFKLNRKYVVYFAGYAHHVSLYPIPPGPASFQKTIEPYIAGKGTLKFMLNKPIPYDLIKEIVQYSLEAHMERMKKNHQGETSEYSFMVAPSSIEGVGVFALHDIPKDTRLELFSDDESRFIPHHKATKEPAHIQKFYKRYCIERKDGYDCPQNFGQMEIGWYLNHSEKPNAYHNDYIYYALRDIKKGEEIVINYETLDDTPQTVK